MTASIFFVISKVIGWVISPLHFLFILLVTTFYCLWQRRYKLAQQLVAIQLVAWIIIGYLPFPFIGLMQLENCIPNPPISFKSVEGIVVLGGAIETGSVGIERGQVTLGDAAERMTMAVSLARQYPHLKILYTGYSGKLFPNGMSEVGGARQFFREQGIAPDRIIYESRSRNTAENASFSVPMLIPFSGDWVLITSAAHMPRSHAVFLKSGRVLIPFSVDYETASSIPWFTFDIGKGVHFWRIIIHEYIGYWVYWITGRL